MYLVTEVAGQAQATVDAKQRDLQRFLTFYQTLYKHDRPDEWFVSVTKAFVKALQQERLAQALAGAHLCHGAALRPLAASEVPGPLPAGLSHRWREAASGTHGRLERPHPA